MPHEICVCGHSPDQHSTCHVSGCTCALLAEALRLLLEMEHPPYNPESGDLAGDCPWCGGRPTHDVRQEYHLPGGFTPKHFAGCRWLALMVKAGLERVT